MTSEGVIGDVGDSEMVGNRNLKVRCARRLRKTNLIRVREKMEPVQREQAWREGNVGIWRQPCQVPFWR